MEKTEPQSGGARIPAQRLAEEAAPKPPPNRQPGKSLKILYADDNLLMGHLVVRVLTSAGHQAEHASDGFVAWERVSRDLHYFDVVITDNDMPKLSGIELVELLRRANFGGRIFVHSFAMRQKELSKYRELKVDRFVEKGSGSHAMVSAVQELAGA